MPVTHQNPCPLDRVPCLTEHDWRDYRIPPLSLTPLHDERERVLQYPNFLTADDVHRLGCVWLQKLPNGSPAASID
eukprot:6702578-Pyramimonas_sp.AAC.1